MFDNHFKEILDCLLDNTLSIFCGAGATADATHSEWKHIFSQKTQTFLNNSYTDDLYLLADLEKKYYNQENFYNDIHDKIAIFNNCNSEHINSIVKLNLNQIWTTNFDEIIENTIYKIHNFHPTIIKDSNDILIKDINSKYIVYKVNGSITDKNSMVLTKSDFYNYFKRQRVLFEILKRQLVINSFLFIGYSFKDDLILNALREIKEVFPTQGKTHYRFVLKSDNIDKQEYLKYEAQYYEDNYNIKTIYIDNFEEIDQYLNELYNKYCERNILITGSYRNINNAHRIYIENLIDNIVYQLYKNNYNIFSGNGRGIGEIVHARTNKYSNIFPKSKLISRPLIFSGDSDIQKDEKNRQIIKDCKVNIIICGQDDTLITSNNVIKQAKLFIDNDNLVIPLPTTKYAAEEIFNSDFFKNSSFYKINKSNYELLKSDDISVVVKTVVNMILQIYKPI